MGGSTLGVWVAHGEGRVHFPKKTMLEKVLKQNLAPVRYVNDDNEATEQYPFNPNGSEHGIAGLCSPDGRHLAMMPHPERAFVSWQQPWVPQNMRNTGDDNLAGPWLKMFQNARIWCEDIKK